jgi:CheY-like chemotaxis protein
MDGGIMPITILWVDDEWTYMPELIEKCQKNNILMECAANLEEAKQKLEKNNYNGILLDMIFHEKGEASNLINTRKIDKPFLGLDVLEYINNISSNLPKPKIIIMTIADDDRLAGKWKKIDKNGLIAKIIMKTMPYSLDDVVKILQDTIPDPELNQRNGGV